MINLFETFNEQTRVLYETLKQVSMTETTIVIDDDGFLPKGVTSPYQFFAENEYLSTDKPLFYNEVVVPELWEIDGNNNEAFIKDMGRVRAHIKYKKNFKHRIVKCIEWMDEDGNIRTIEFYNQQGIHFNTQVYDLNQQLIFSTYYNRNHQTIIYENYITNDYVVNYNEKEYYFKDKAQFIIFYLKEAFDKLDNFLVNSLSYPFIAVYQLGIPGKDYLFWQETSSEVPGNMIAMLKSDIRDFTILVPSEEEYTNLKTLLPHEQRIKKTGYIYSYLKPITINKEILIVTNSDQLEQIITIIDELSNHMIHIAAITEMSPKLLSLSKYTNVRLYPNIKRSTLIELYKKSSIYLDINHGNEILESVRGAFDYNMLILGFNHIAHNRTYTLPKHLVLKQQIYKLLEFIKQAEKPEQFNEMLTNQKIHANAITTQLFLKQF